LTLKSKGAATGVFASGEENLITGPREMPRVATALDAGGRAASFALIKGAAKPNWAKASNNAANNRWLDFIKPHVIKTIFN
jgi:hypothetical protein